MNAPSSIDHESRPEVFPSQIDEDSMGAGRIVIVGGLGEVEPEVPGKSQLLLGHVLQVQIIFG